MKRLALAIGLVVTTIVIAVFSLVAVEKANKNMIFELDNILKYAKEENPELLSKSIENAIGQWEKEKPILNILIGQKETNEITNDLKMIKHFSRESDKNSLFLYIYECKTELERIKSTNEPSLSTIF